MEALFQEATGGSFMFCRRVLVWIQQWRLVVTSPSSRCSFGARHGRGVPPDEAKNGSRRTKTTTPTRTEQQVGKRTKQPLSQMVDLVFWLCLCVLCVPVLLCLQSRGAARDHLTLSSWLSSFCVVCLCLLVVWLVGTTTTPNYLQQQHSFPNHSRSTTVGWILVLVVDSCSFHNYYDCRKYHHHQHESQSPIPDSPPNRGGGR